MAVALAHLKKRVFMDRRGFLKLCIAAGTLSVGAQRLFADDTAGATLTLTPGVPSTLIAPDFLGFSYETSLMTSPDFLSPTNSTLLALYSLLGKNGVIRIGGNSSEYGLWRPNGDITPVVKRHIITPDVIKRVAAFVHATGWQCIYGLILGQGNPADSADEAAAVAAALGSSLIAFQIGNEPDLFNRGALRSTTYGSADYLTEWKTFADAVKVRVPSAQFAGPDTASSMSWVDAIAAAYGSQLSFLSNHYYSEGPGSSPNSTIDKMMHTSVRLDNMLNRMESAAQSIGRPYRMTELNSVYGGGRRGVSDTQAAAVWGLDLMMRVTLKNGLGVNFHGGAGGAYSPVQVTDGVAGPTPLFYALLAFAQIGAGAIAPVSLKNAPTDLSGYAVKGNHGKLTFVVVNSNTAQPTSVTINSIRQYRNSYVWRLSAPSFDALNSTSFAGASITQNNTWESVTKEGVLYQDADFSIVLPAASAAVIKLE